MSATGEKVKEYGNRILASATSGDNREEKLLKADLHREKAEGIAAVDQEKKYEERAIRQQKDLDMTEQKLQTAQEYSQQANLPDPKKVVDSSQRVNKMGETKDFNQIDPSQTTTTTRTVHSTTKTSGGI